MSARPLSTGLKCLEMLEIVAGLPGPGRLADLARAAGESRATTHQRLLTLVTAGWVERDAEGHYRLSLRPCRIARAALDQAGLGDRVLPVMERLTARTGHASSLIVLEGTRIVIAQRVEVGGVLRADLRPGAAMPWSVSASALVWLAFGPADLARRLEEAGEALPDPARVGAARASGLAQGLAEGALDGIGALAAPVRDGTAGLVASLSLVGPESRFDPDTLGPLLTGAAAELTDLLDGTR